MGKYDAPFWNLTKQFGKQTPLVILRRHRDRNRKKNEKPITITTNDYESAELNLQHSMRCVALAKTKTVFLRIGQV
jgi:hypothetical protein